jgi:hypothetical protein
LTSAAWAGSERATSGTRAVKINFMKYPFAVAADRFSRARE